MGAKELMDNKKAFSLISFMIYLVLFTMIIGLMFQWSVDMVVNNIRINEQARQISCVCMMHDLLVKDLHQAPSSIKQWDISSLCVCWHTAQGSVEWQLDKEILIRAQGVYDAVNNKWISKKKKGVGMHIKLFKIEPHLHGERITHVICTIASEHYSICTPIAII